MAKSIWIEIKTDMNLTHAASLVGRVLGEVSFQADPSGDYEEYPAFVAVHGLRKYVLLGAPASEDDFRDHPTDGLQLRIEEPDEANCRNAAAEILSALSAVEAFDCAPLG